MSAAAEIKPQKPFLETSIVFKICQVTQPKSPKFSKMSWERRAEGGADRDAAADRERDRLRERQERERQEKERQEKERARKHLVAAAAAAAPPVQSSLLRPTASWKAGYGQQPEVAPAKPRAASAGAAALRQRQSKHADADVDDDAIEDGLRMLRARRK